MALLDFEEQEVTLTIRPFAPTDADGVWDILGPTIRQGATYALPADMGRDEALAYWDAPGHRVFVAVVGETVVGTYYLRTNQLGGGSHIANCGYMVGRGTEGRGVARSMCLHSLSIARASGFRAMQFNFVVSANARAVALWKSLGFSIVGTLPEAFKHPELGFVDAYVMHRRLERQEDYTAHQPSSLDQLRAVT